MSSNLLRKFKESNLSSKSLRKDKQAFIEIYSLYVDDIYRFIYFKVGHREEAQDIASDVFLKAWDYIVLNKINKSKNLKALFYKIARNSVIDYYRSKRDTSPLESLENTDLKDIKQDPQALTEIKHDYERILKLLNKLKEEYKEVIVLKHINELSWDEISQALGKSKGSLRVLLHRATKALEEEDRKDMEAKNTDNE
ncbi:MAG: RNA polymerase sigma factor [Parcubacteria group bacterium]